MFGECVVETARFGSSDDMHATFDQAGFGRSVGGGGRCRIRKEGIQAERVVRVVGGLLHRQAERLKGSSRRVEWL